MKRTTIAAVLAVLTVTPALAGDPFSTGDSHGPRAPSGRTEGYSGQSIAPAPAARHEFTAGVWQPFDPAKNPNAVSADELSRQNAVNKAWNRAAYERFVEGGGCNAAYLSHRAAEACWHQGNASAGTQMGSQGGE